jgi:hypothetical protein
MTDPQRHPTCIDCNTLPAMPGHSQCDLCAEYDRRPVQGPWGVLAIAWIMVIWGLVAWLIL